MILQNSGRSFEQCRSMNQELTFHTLQTEMQRRSIEIGASQMRTLKLIGEDGEQDELLSEIKELESQRSSLDDEINKYLKELGILED